MLRPSFGVARRPARRGVDKLTQLSPLVLLLSCGSPWVHHPFMGPADLPANASALALRLSSIGEKGSAKRSHSSAVKRATTAFFTWMKNTTWTGMLPGTSPVLSTIAALRTVIWRVSPESYGWLRAEKSRRE